MARGDRYEGSRKDRKADMQGRKKAGMSAKAWEGSAEDKAKDAAGQRAMNKRKKRKAK